MIVVLSDLHFQDTGTSGPGSFSDANVQPGAFAHLWSQVDQFAERVRADDVTIVLAGDVLELLRSERWFVDGTRPYNFVDDVEPRALATAAAIGNAILDENARAIAALAGGRGARFVVVPGNHDRLLREPSLAPVRARCAQLLGGNVTYTDEHRDLRHRVVVQHGHELDWTCSEYQVAREFERWDGRDPSLRRLAPLGDWIGLDIGARLPYLAWQMLSSGDRRWSDLPPWTREDLYARLVYLDDLRPQGEVLRWLVHPGGLANLTDHAGEIAVVTRFLGDLLNELIATAMPRVEPWLEAHGRPLFDRLALGAVALLASTKYTAPTLPAVMERIATYLSGQDRPWQVVQRTEAWRDPAYAYFVSGHTHEPKALPLRQAGGLGPRPMQADEGGWYVNTGTWRKTILRSPTDSRVFGAVKQFTFAVIYDADEAFRATGRRGGGAFDLWQASSQRF